MARPKIIKKAPGLGKEELGKLLDYSLSCDSQLQDAKDCYKELYDLILSLDTLDDIAEVRDTVARMRQEGQFVGLMIDGAKTGIEWLIAKNRSLAAYVQHKQLLWEEQQKNIGKELRNEKVNLSRV